MICLSESTLTPTVQEDAAVPSVREQVHHGPQLPPDQLGANISEVSAEVRWSQFWSDIKKRKLYLKSLDTIKKVKSSTSKTWFLSKCLKLNVVPTTCRSNIKHSKHFSKQGQNQWEETKKRAGVLFTETALQEEKVRLVMLKKFSLAAECLLHEQISETYLKAQVSDNLQKQGRSYMKQMNNNHKQRLKNLLAEQNLNIPSFLNDSGQSSINSSIASQRSQARRFNKKRRQKREAQKKNRTPVQQLYKNYSDVTLTDGEVVVLNKGLNFCPMRKRVNRTDIEVSMQRYARTCRWREFWERKRGGGEGEGEEGDQVSAMKNIFKDPTEKTNFPQNHHCPPKLQDHLTATHIGMIGAPLNNVQSNLSEEAWLGIKSLQERQRKKEIIIKPNDKTGGCSVLNYNSYVDAMKSKLLETFHDKNGIERPKYERVDKPALKRNWQIVKELVSEGRECGYITESDAPLMLPAEPKPGRLYGLVKDHKPANPVTGLPPLREVVSGSGSNTEFMSAFVDHHMKEEVRKLNSFIEDSPHFLREIEEINKRGRLPEQAIPVTMDITALYPSIPWAEGLEAMELAAEQRTDKTVPTSFLLRLMLVVLATNIFEFDGELWLQKDGTAIGTRAAPTFANLFMAKWEATLLDMEPKHLIDFWRRFIDDIFFIWYGTKSELESFITMANTLMPSIKVTCEFNFDTKAVNFLDTTVFIDSEGYLRTDLYQKDNMKISYLLPSSAHPSHISQNIPYSLAYRLKRICWSDELFAKRLLELEEALVCRGYKRKSLKDIFTRVGVISRAESIKKVTRNREVSNRARFIVKYDPRLPNVREILQRSWRVMVEDPTMKKCFPNPPMVCYQRVENIREMLVKAKLPVNHARKSSRIQDKPRGFKPCGEPRCPVCDQLREKKKIVTSITCSATGEEIDIKDRLTCSSTNVIYCITCRRGGRTCPNNPQYIGETKKSLRERFRGHRGTIIQSSQENTSAPVGAHFRGSGHSICDLEIVPIEKVRQENLTRKVRESLFIRRFDTVNCGLNIRR